MIQIPYQSFLDRKRQFSDGNGFDPVFMPSQAFDFQQHIISWAVTRGRAAILADCGLGKTLMQLAWAQNVAQKTNGRVLILTPLAVARQTANEADKFGIETEVSRDGTFSKSIVITNYEKLEHFNAKDFVGVVCDESSILKSYGGARRKAITRFMSKHQYRLLCTATAAPNDWIELGTSSEALGELSDSEMKKRFFRQLDDKGQKKERKQQLEAEKLIERDPSYFQKLSYRVAQTIGQWRLRHHAVDDFWRWVASWAIACRKPSDLGFSDDGFVLPELREIDHSIMPDKPPEGFLFNVPAVGLAAERSERKRTLEQRCEMVAELVDHNRPAVVWCHTNPEGDLLEQVIPDAAQVAGRTPDDQKIEIYETFSSGELLKLIIKPKIGAWGMNWQHCHDTVSFPTHSYEQYYQSIRRFYRFGQKHRVTSHTVSTEGELGVLENMRSKGVKAGIMFDALISSMNQSTEIQRSYRFSNKPEVPAWL